MQTLVMAEPFTSLSAVPPPAANLLLFTQLGSGDCVDGTGALEHMDCANANGHKS